jgi:hypothetical protein
VRKIIGVAVSLLVIGAIIGAASHKSDSSAVTTDAGSPPAATTSTPSAGALVSHGQRPGRPGAAASAPVARYSGVAPNASYGPATDQSACPATHVTVGPATSCEFAHNVDAVAGTAHRATGHYPASLTASSPVTGKTYRLRCSISGYGSELVCGTLPPATGIVVIPFGAPAASPAAPTTSQSTSAPQPASEGPGSFDHAGDAEFCSTHGCIENFPNGNGYVVQCADGEWSHSGGLSGVCSDHGGES